MQEKWFVKSWRLNARREEMLTQQYDEEMRRIDKSGRMESRYKNNGSLMNFTLT